MASESISVLLQKSLELIQCEDSTESKDTGPTAASILIAEKKKAKDLSASRQAEEFIPVATSKASANIANPFFDQIADSSIDAPTYWKGLGQQKAKGKQIAEPVITNARKASRLKGEAYEDKRLSKHASVASRKDRMHRLKNLY